MRRIIALVLTLCGGVAVSAAPQITSQELAPETPEYTLDNGVLQVKCIPAASGLITGFKYLPEQRQMIFPHKFTLVQDDLLPSRVSMRPCGMRELANRTKMEYFIGYRVKDARTTPAAAVLQLYSRAFYRHNMIADKTVTLPAGSSKISVRMDLTSQVKTEPVIFWINALANLDTTRDTTLVPVQKNAAPRYKYSMNVFNTSGVYVDKFILPQTLFAAPLKPWYGRISAQGKPGVLVLVVRGDAGKRLVEHGFICGWKSEIMPIHTTELRFAGPEMGKGDKWSFEYDYIYFAKLQQLRDVAGDYGIDLQGNTLHIASAVVAAPGTMKLTWNGGAAEVALPALKPGEVFKYELPAGAKNISGTMPGGEKFDIPALLTEQYK